jgi:hypothetical protein
MTQKINIKINTSQKQLTWVFLNGMCLFCFFPQIPLETDALRVEHEAIVRSDAHTHALAYTSAELRVSTPNPIVVAVTPTWVHWAIRFSDRILFALAPPHSAPVVDQSSSCHSATKASTAAAAIGKTDLLPLQWLPSSNICDPWVLAQNRCNIDEQHGRQFHVDDLRTLRIDRVATMHPRLGCLSFSSLSKRSPFLPPAMHSSSSSHSHSTVTSQAIPPGNTAGNTAPVMPVTVPVDGTKTSPSLTPLPALPALPVDASATSANNTSNSGSATSTSTITNTSPKLIPSTNINNTNHVMVSGGEEKAKEMAAASLERGVDRWMTWRYVSPRAVTHVTLGSIAFLLHHDLTRSAPAVAPASTSTAVPPSTELICRLSAFNDITDTFDTVMEVSVWTWGTPAHSSAATANNAASGSATSTTNNSTAGAATHVVPHRTVAETWRLEWCGFPSHYVPPSAEELGQLVSSLFSLLLLSLF